jgi:hypothetical protein
MMREVMLITFNGSPKEPVLAVIATAQYPAAGAPVFTVRDPVTLCVQRETVIVVEDAAAPL